MNIFNYHPVTRELVDMSKADPDPLIPDRWLVPAFATVLAPPECLENEIAVFSGESWSVSPDYRGVDYWDIDGIKHTVEVLGENIPEGSILKPPPTLEENQAVVVKNGAWEVVPDFVGVEYWDDNGQRHVISELGEEIPEGAFLEESQVPVTVKKQMGLAGAECTKRINSKWNWLGQINASLGIYSDDEIEACKQWISDHRSALADLLAMDDLVELDVTDDQYWPS